MEEDSLMAQLLSFDNLLKALEEYAIAIRNEYQDNLIRSDRIASGDLLNNVEFEVLQNGAAFKVNLLLAPYWKYLEEGTKPHFPPVDALLKWIEVKPVLPRPDKNGKLPTPKQLAFLIGRKISEDGTQGTQDLQRTTRSINEQHRQKIIDAFRMDVQNTMDGYIIEFFK
jgi:hypothetical protein